MASESSAFCTIPEMITVYALRDRSFHSLAACLMKLIFLSFLDLGEFSVEFILKHLFLQSLLICSVKSVPPQSTSHLLKTTEILLLGVPRVWKSIPRNMEDETEKNVQIPSG